MHACLVVEANARVVIADVVCVYVQRIGTVRVGDLGTYEIIVPTIVEAEYLYLRACERQHCAEIVAKPASLDGEVRVVARTGAFEEKGRRNLLTTARGLHRHERGADSYAVQYTE